MSASAQGDCETVLATNLALLSQFQKSLTAPKVGSAGTDTSTSSTGEHPSPLLLLKAAAGSVRATTTKLSLLSINVPFTASAVTSLVKPLNDSILPSLVTAALLVTPSNYPDAFASETTRLAATVLMELQILVELVRKRARDGQPNREMSKSEKQAFTETTGRVWEACDLAIDLSAGGVAAFSIKKVEQWLSLMKDAVEELQEWDPDEDVDDIWGGALSDDGNDKYTDKKEDHNQAAIAAGVKEQALKVLSRIPQSIHVVLKQRIAKMPAELVEPGAPNIKKHKTTINLIIKNARHISECIDESAEAIYMGNPEQCLKKAGEARAVTIDVVNAVLSPWQSQTQPDEPSKEDTFIKRALLWIQQVDTTNSSSPNGK